MQHGFAARLDDVLSSLSGLAVGERSEYVRFLVGQARELNYYNETVIALENLCDNLQEQPSVPLTAEVCQDIIDLARSMGLRQCYYGNLVKLVE